MARRRALLVAVGLGARALPSVGVERAIVDGGVEGVEVVAYDLAATPEASPVIHVGASW